MAHMAKIKRVAVAPMVAHYERVPEVERGFERDNIDSARTHLNYNLRPHDVRAVVADAVERHQRAAGRKLRSDANVLLDWVVTLPKDCPAERSREFFEACAAFLEKRYGEGNLLGAYVHEDETTPHMHAPVLPQIGEKLLASRMVDRQDLRTFHRDLSAHVDAALGMHVSIELDEQQKGEKQLSRLSQDEYIAAKQRLERLRREEVELGREVEQLEPAAETLPESARALLGGIGDGKREEGLAGEIDGLRSRISELERANEQARRREAELGEEVRGLGGRAGRLAERLGDVAAKVKAALKTLPTIAESAFSARALAWARGSGLEVVNTRELGYAARQAEQAARALNAQRNPVERNHER